MTNIEIAYRRLYNQHLAHQVFTQPDKLCAIQGQDYARAKWAVGMRLQKGIDSDKLEAFTYPAYLISYIFIV